MHRLLRRRLAWGFGIVILVVVIAESVSPRAQRAPEKVEARVVSTRPETVSDGNALVDITGVAPQEAATITVTVNGRNVTTAFRSVTPGTTLRGRIESLTLGVNTLEVRAGSTRLARLELKNHARVGPIISGPHQRPFNCETVDAGLGAPVDGDCSVSTVISYVYKSTDPPPAPPARGAAPAAGRGRGTGGPSPLPAGFKPFSISGPKPADVARTRTSLGNTVDYIVRRERGTMNRAIYEIAFLHVPGEPLPDPWTTTPSWNRRLVYTFGGGCAAGYRQGSAASALLDNALSGGYAVAASSLNVFGTNCDDLISAESMMMVKEHFIERFGAPVYTIGNGGSGGSMQQHLIAQNYPGLLDGLTPSVSFPDGLAVWSSSADCSLLANAFERAAESWTEEQRRAASGFATWRVCGTSWARSNLQRSASCPEDLPRDVVYNAATNPKGARCSTTDNEINSFGTDPKTGFGRRPLDNVGVQYGLVAFNAGQIRAAQFVELNERVGGHDVDGNIVSARTVGDPMAIRLAYTTGRLQTGSGSLGSIPIIDTRGYADPTGDIHDSYRSFVTRARIAAANNGRTDNHVIFRTPGAAATAAGAPPRPSPFNALRVMDAWLDKLSVDMSSDPIHVKVARSRPADAVDTCWSETGEKIVEPASYAATNRCNTLYPPHADPRIAAGAPLVDDILKCTLKPFDPKDYKTPLSAEQTTRLKSVFRTGVCDYSKPGVEQRRVDGTWRSFGGSR